MLCYWKESSSIDEWHVFTKMHFTVFSPVQYSNVVTTWNFPRNCLSLSSTYLIDPVFLSCRGSLAILKIVVKNRLFYHIEVPVHRQYSNNVQYKFWKFLSIYTQHTFPNNLMSTDAFKVEKNIFTFTILEGGTGCQLYIGDL